MSQSLARNAQEISAQRDEIEAFNRVLQERVEARTLELRQTQDRLVQSARLAAVGELGAGMAHELNNPVAGILGMVQVLLRRRPDGPEQPMLRTIEQLAVRCKDIVVRLVGLSQGTLEGPDTPTAEVGPIDLDTLLDSALALFAGPLLQRGLGVQRAGLRGLVVQGDRAELLRALAQVLLSLRAAARQGGTLVIQLGLRDEDVLCEIILDAPVIDVGGDDWMATGLGFWAARQTLARHRGHLGEPDGPPASGRATWTVALPRA